MLIKYFGGGDLISVAFFDIYDDLDIDIQSASSTQFVARNPTTGAVTTVTGSNLPSAAQFAAGVFQGTVTGWSTTAPGPVGQIPLATVTGINWSLVTLIAALEEDDDDEGASIFSTLLSQQNVTFDASEATDGVDDVDLWGVTSNATFIGSRHGDSFAGGDGNDNIRTGGAAYGQGDQIYGSGGNDRIDFGDIRPGDGWTDLVYAWDHNGINVTINGTTNTGTVTSAIGNDTLVNVNHALSTQADGFSVAGSPGNDTFNITLGADQWMNVDGGAGRDSYNFTLGNGASARLSFRGIYQDDLATHALNINLATGQILNDGYGNTETVNVTVSGNGRLEIHGTDYGHDRIIGSDAREVFILGGGNSTLDAGGGWDRLRFDRSQITSGVTVDLGAGTATGFWYGQRFNHTIAGIEEVRGSRFGDMLDASGVSFGVRLDGRGGNDTLKGGSGNDTLVASAGNLVIDGGAGHDELEFNVNMADVSFVAQTANNGGVAGGVWVSTATGYFSVIGVEEFRFRDGVRSLEDILPPAPTGPTEGNDTLHGTAGADSIDGLGGDDLIYGEAGNDTLIGGAGNDTLYGGEGNDTLEGQAGRDEIFGGDGNDWIHGGADADLLIGGAGNDTIYGGVGNDLIYGNNTDGTSTGGDHDSLFGGAGNDTIYGGDGNDTVNGGDGADLIYLGGGNDRYEDTGENGPNGADTVYGGDGADWLHGGGGPDVLYGDAGNDTIYGGQGHDRVYGGIGNDSLLGGLGNDSLYGGDGADTIDAGDGDDYVNGGEGADLVYLGAGNDKFEDTGTNGALGADTVYGGSGNDWIHGGGGPDVLHGDAGNDTLFGGQGHDALYGGDGADQLHGGLGNDSVYGGNGRDSAWLGDGDDRYEDTTQDGVAGQDTVYGGNGNDWIHGGGGDDVLHGDVGFDTLYGGQGNDILYGGNGLDQLFGGLGDDTIYGGNGNDILSGGAGADSFVFRSGEVGASRITDFGNGDDLLVLDAGLWSGTRTSAEVVEQFARVTGAGVLFDFGSQTMLLEGLTSTAGLADDIAFL